MSASNLNPNHPVTQAMDTEWHKIVAILMHKLGLNEVELTEADINAFVTSGYAAVTIHAGETTLRLNLATEAEAERLAREHGGLPV